MMTFKEFMERQVKLMQYCEKRYKIPPASWIQQNSARYRERIVKRFGMIVHPS